MQTRFRQFMSMYDFPCRLREEEAAPTVGANPPVPDNPKGTTNKYHFDAMKRQLGIDDESFTAAIETGTVDVWVTPDYSMQWGFMVSGPVSATVEETDAGQYKVTFMLRQKKLMNPHSFILPYKQGQRPMYYDGPVEDKQELISAEQLQDMMVKPFEDGGAMGGMMGGMGMGGAMGGGAPPMGGAPMGGM